MAATLETEAKAEINQNTDKTGTHGGIFTCSTLPKF
jgi:hypothetical protein